MKAVSEKLTRQMLLIDKLRRAVVPVEADLLFDYLRSESGSRNFSYPDDRKSCMRQLQRDVRDIADVFKIEISRVGKSAYKIVEEYGADVVDYDRLFAEFDFLVSLNPDTEISRHIIPERSRNKGCSLLPELLQAIKTGCIVEFNYVNYRKGKTERRHKVEPHYLKEDQGLWYLIGYENDRLLIFALDRIRGLLITDESFRFRDDVDISDYFKDSFGIWSDVSVPTEEIELRYDSLDGSFLKARPLHPTQKVVADTDDEFRIVLRLKITNDFVMALLSRARSLEVIRPLHLRERIRDTLAAALARNS